MNHSRRLCKLSFLTISMVGLLLAILSCSASAVTISGRIADASNVGIGGVSITANNAGGSTTSAGDGTYSLTVVSGWSGTVCVLKSGYIIVPSMRSYSNVTANKTAQDYVATPAPSGGFFAEIQAPFPAIGYGEAVWGDYDADSKMDLLFVGDAGTTAGIIPTTTLLRNTGSMFAKTDSPIAPVTNATPAWYDYDGDGRLDLAIGGWNMGSYCNLYHGEAGGTFSDTGAFADAPTESGTSWGDYNNDGRPDLAISSWDNSFIYRNDGNGIFTSAVSNLAGARYTQGAWADYDNDGDLDVLACGHASSGASTVLYRNDNGVFENSSITLPQVQYSSVAWGDYDSDGNLDLAMCGQSYGWPYTYIYHNDGAGNLTSVGTSIVSVAQGCVAWGDYDNDGDLDLAICGATSNGRVSKVYRNDSGNFVEQCSLTGVQDGWLSWGDYDNDGALDLVITGATTNNVNDPQRVSKLYHNISPVKNTPPAPPTGLSTRIVGQDLVLSWSAASDAQSIAGGLSYNIRAGSSSSSQDIIPGCSDISTGARLIPAIGNAQKNLSYTLKGLGAGSTCCWSVQAIDSNFAGSQWATSVSVSLVKISGGIVRSDGLPVAGVKVSANNGGGYTYTNADGYYEVLVCSGWSGKITPSKTDYSFNPTNRTYTAVTSNRSRQNFTATPPRWEAINVGTGVIGGQIAWGDYDNDGWLDLALTGGTTNWWGIDNPTDPELNVYHNANGSGTFAQSLHISPGYGRSSLAWGDMDGDGWLDLAAQGTQGVAGYPYTRVIKNTDGFLNGGPGLSPSLMYGSLEWGDYNNDGSLDLLTTGFYWDGSYHMISVADIYANNRTLGTLVPINSGIVGGETSKAAWTDYNNDGRLDVGICSSSIYGPSTSIYRNDAGSFTNVSTSIPGMRYGYLAWGDYNNDGRTDLAINGEECKGGVYAYKTYIFRNDGNGVFTNINAGLVGLQCANMAWGDYNNDGKLDLMIDGSDFSSGTETAICKLYKNMGGDSFSEVSTGIAPVMRASMAWGDYNNDGSLDFAIAGMEQNGTIVAKVYQNNSYLDTAAPNNVPTAPTGLTAVRNGTDVTFSWLASTDAETSASGLTYNLRVGTTSGADDVMPGMSASNGWRKVVAFGNAQKMLTWTIHNLPTGTTFYWSVQAIDPSFAGSAWAAQQTLAPVASKSVAEVKKLTDNELVNVDAAIVSRVFTNFFYIEADNRYCGIRVNKTNHGLALGMRADISGSVKTGTDGERYIEATVANPHGQGFAQPLWMKAGSIGGGNWNYTTPGTGGQAGMKDMAGLNNVGLLVCVCGNVSYSTSGYFYIDDGSNRMDVSGHSGIKVLTNGFASPDQDTFQRVVGVVSCYKSGIYLYPQIRVQLKTDIIEIPTW